MKGCAAGIALAALISCAAVARDGFPGPGVISAHALAHKPPKDARREFEQGMHFWRKGRNDQATAHWLAAVRLDPEFVEALTALAALYIIERQAEPGLEYANRALALEPNWAALHCNKAFALLMLNRAGEAEQAARRAVQLDPGWVEASYTLALAMLHQSKVTPETVRRLAEAEGKYPAARALLEAVQPDLPK